ncbi:hypothetical protein CgunFtcFv8_016888 [Champsocephalus gunnari]|uniref:Uncharacterized protein n=1 Tax=Champsocephalus gunnari TaxID=52237 RepID=A0AAN8CRE0_CHAGU|nr:hypothetical protein CgunFtcFv8_016888 [Champsocephalus gunnari]
MRVLDGIKAECCAPNTAIRVSTEALFDAVTSPVSEVIIIQRDGMQREDRWRDGDEDGDEDEDVKANQWVACLERFI